MTDDEDDSPEFPDAVRAAGLIWLGIGGLAGLGAAATLVALLSGTLTDSPFGWLLVFLLSGAAIALLSVGRHTFHGTNPGVDLEGSKSILTGVFALVVGLFFLVIGDPRPRAGGWELPAFGGGLIGVGVLMVVAGSLARSGQSRYMAWRRVHHRPGRTDEPDG